MHQLKVARAGIIHLPMKAPIAFGEWMIASAAKGAKEKKAKERKKATRHPYTAL